MQQQIITEKIQTFDSKLIQKIETKIPNIYERYPSSLQNKILDNLEKIKKITLKRINQEQAIQKQYRTEIISHQNTKITSESTESQENKQLAKKKKKQNIAMISVAAVGILTFTIISGIENISLGFWIGISTFSNNLMLYCI